MKKWLCTVCGYEHEGDSPPDTCPICGVGPENFTLVSPPSAEAAPKRWKCIICDYVHSGDEPPDVCPVCGVGKENFILLADDISAPIGDTSAVATEAVINAALDAVSYGLYIVSSTKDGKINGQTANSVFQLTAVPPQVAVCINTRNLTHEYISASGHFAISILSKDQSDIVRHFGYQSGRKTDKFATVEYVPGANGCPILAKCLGYLEAEVIPEKSVNVGTHTVFVAKVTSGRILSHSEALTYHFYREKKK